jgi:hypothetical protein
MNTAQRVRRRSPAFRWELGLLARSTALTHCTKCTFSFRPRANYLTLDFCPRCLAKNGVAVDLVADNEPASLVRSPHEI